MVYRRGGRDSLLIVLELGLEGTDLCQQAENNEVTCGDIIHVMCMFTVVWYTSGLGVINILLNNTDFNSYLLHLYHGPAVICRGSSASEDSYAIELLGSLFARYGCELALLAGFSELNIYCIDMCLMKNKG